MATGFGFCASCGTAATGLGEKFCGSCGAALPAGAAAAAAAAVPPPYSPPPPPYAPPPPAYGQPPYGQPPYAPVGPARSAVNPLLLVVGALIILAIVGVGALALTSKNSPSSSGGSSVPSAVGSVRPSGGTASHYPGSIVFSPSTINCPSGPFTTTVRLPASVTETDQITYRIDTTDIVTQTVVDFGMTQQADGTWLVTDTNANGSSNCAMGPGVHTARLLDSSGQVLAQGTFTFVLSGTAKPTVKPTQGTGGSITFQPSTISCSAASVTITVTLKLPASFSGSDLITAQIDGQVGATNTVDSAFTKQADGSWISNVTSTSATYCGQYAVGKHTFSLLDQGGHVILQGSFTVNP